ncbi:MAG TPA: hypothetical protein VD948_05115 [Rhodothermales bacterium]|nr:hypothetical protein [Rhodothermales bacterium]
MTWPDVAALTVVMAGFVGIAWAAAWCDAQGRRSTDRILDGLREPMWKHDRTDEDTRP